MPICTCKQILKYSCINTHLFKQCITSDYCKERQSNFKFLQTSYLFGFLFLSLLPNYCVCPCVCLHALSAALPDFLIYFLCVRKLVEEPAIFMFLCLWSF